MNPWYLSLGVILHFISLAGLAVYGFHRLWMLHQWKKSLKPSGPVAQAPGPDSFRPMVTIQLPLYNERLVAARLMDAVAGIDWPQDRLEIQVLDDSTDDTTAIVDERARHWAKAGMSIRIMRRRRRTGYKAGALAFGLEQAQGDFIAVFDADFLPPQDFLLKTVPFFQDPGVGMVQTRWGFLNAHRSWFTRLQEVLLASHFDIEHQVRHSRSLFFNFNGTAGIWRRRAIETAGGWQADTVTEDLDLSYRAQMKGWRFVYCSEPKVPSELPPTLADFRSQQARWAKGSIQTARKLLPGLLRAPLPAAIKIEALLHLLSNLGWLLGALVILTLYPALLARLAIGPCQVLWIDLPFFLISGGAVFLYYFYYSLYRKDIKAVMVLSLLPVLSIGLAPALGWAVLTGIFTKGGRFQRTPKYGMDEPSRRAEFSFLRSESIWIYLLIHMGLFAYCQLPIFLAFSRGTWPALPFLLLFPLGFGLIIAMDLQGQ